MTNRERFLAILKDHLTQAGVDPSGSVLVLGAGSDDLSTLAAAGFRQVTATNLESDLSRVLVPAGMTLDVRSADAEALPFENDSVDVVFAHEVLHHCASPHRALGEMLRIARRLVVFLEPNDSFAMRLLVRFGLSFPFEIAAVVDNGFVRGGRRDSAVPNFIFRWNHREVWKTASCFLAERELVVRSFPYWDLGVDERSLSLRHGTRIGALSRLLGGRNLVRLLRLLDRLANLLPPVRRQGNKFFCCVEKRPELRAWLRRDGESIVFDRSYVG